MEIESIAIRTFGKALFQRCAFCDPITDVNHARDRRATGRAMEYKRKIRARVSETGASEKRSGGGVRRPRTRVRCDARVVASAAGKGRSIGINVIDIKG